MEKGSTRIKQKLPRAKIWTLRSWSGTKFTYIASITSIDDDHGWYYKGCTESRKKCATWQTYSVTELTATAATPLPTIKHPKRPLSFASVVISQFLEQIILKS
ncbi:hypothetical protein L1887_16935 [Cichorium endivia]|nr:hypothetical protein L1887_16935 [Cichorium endivia]